MVNLALTEQRQEPEVGILFGVHGPVCVCAMIHCPMARADGLHPAPLDTPGGPELKQGHVRATLSEGAHRAEPTRGREQQGHHNGQHQGQGLKLAFPWRNKLPGHSQGGFLGGGEELSCMRRIAG